MKQLIHVIALGTLLATGSGLSVQAQPIKQHPGHCPPGWVPATPPLNPQLGCLPGNMQAQPSPQPTQATLKRQKKVSVFRPIQQQPQQLPLPGCSPGWTQATQPLNPQLGCLPTQLQVAPSRPW